MASNEGHGAPFGLIANGGLRTADVGDQRLPRLELVEQLENIADRGGQTPQIRGCGSGDIDNLQSFGPFESAGFTDTRNAKWGKGALHAKSERPADQACTINCDRIQPHALSRSGSV